MKSIIHLALKYHPQSTNRGSDQPLEKKGEAIARSHGVWLPDRDVDGWISLMLLQPAGPTTRYFPLPEQGGLVALSSHPISVGPGRTSVTLRRLQVASSNQAELWLSADSRLEPTIPGEWLTRSLPNGDGVVSVWLPRIGLVVFDERDRIGLPEIVSPPINTKVSSTWKTPPEVPVLPTRLAGLALSMPMTGEDVLGSQSIASEGEGIGDQSGDLSKLTGEHKSGTDKFKSWLLNKLEGSSDDPTANHSTDNNPTAKDSAADASSSSSGAGLGALSSAVAGFLSGSVKKERDSQLNKLLEMTKFDPDKALRFAIPLADAASGLAAFRGLAIPGAKLLSRAPNFSLGSIGGGAGPADFWDVDPAVRAKLLKAYNEMANREVAAGRFRRAAYIHANLLGNLPNAASVLEQGGFYQEAAVVYRDKLARPADAARCLMAAGLFEQAAELYAKQKDYPNECEAWRNAGRDDLAEAALEKSVASLISRHQIVEASKFIIEHLRDDERALALLTDQWPNGHQIQSSMRLAFEWIGKRRAHEQARKQLEHCIETATKDCGVALVELTRDVAGRYPDQELQKFAADQCRVAAASILSEAQSKSAADSEASNQALALLRTLEGAESAFASDVDRFRKRCRNTKRKMPARRLSRSDRKIQVLEPLVFSEATYRCFGMWKQQLFALHRSGTEIHAYLFDYPNRPLIQNRHRRFVSVPDPFADTPVDRLDSNVLVTNSRIDVQSPFAERWFSKFVFDTSVSEVAVHGGWQGSLQNVDAAVSLEDGGFAAVETIEGETQLLVCNEIGLTVRSHSLTSLLLAANFEEFNSEREGVLRRPPRMETTHIATLDQQIVVAIGDTLIVRPDSNNALLQPIGHCIHAMKTSPLNSRKRIAVAHEGGLDMYWPEMGELIRQRIEIDRPFQHVVLMKNGVLFAIADQTLYRYQVKRDSVVADGQMELKHSSPLSLLPLSHSVCGVGHRKGILERFQ